MFVLSVEKIINEFRNSYTIYTFLKTWEETTKGIRISIHVYGNENIGFYYDKKIKSG